MKNSAPIGFLDSGIGGSTVLIKSLSVLPNENYVFFSDSATAPALPKQTSWRLVRLKAIFVLILDKSFGTFT